jgi:ankyrin repeat protein
MDDNYNRTPLMLASLNGHLNSVKVLVELGASLTATNYNNINALKYSIIEGNIDIIEYFIEEGLYNKYLLNNKDITTYTNKESIKKYLELALSKL